MATMTLRETIRDLTAAHLDARHLVMGQCLSAVGWCGNTLPRRQDMTELPCSDVAGSGFAVGAALAGRRPIYVIRYQGFNWLAASFIVNYAAKSKALWGRPCPLLVRSIAMEGQIGPVAGSSHHSVYHRMPGIKNFAPMTPGEWRSAYEEFMAGDDVVFLSEHRGAYDNAEELPPLRPERPEIVLFPISITRFSAAQAAIEMLVESARVAVHHISVLKPFQLSLEASADLRASVYGGVVLDDDYPDGVAKALAFDIATVSGRPMRVMGLAERTAGFAKRLDNLPPSKDEIKNLIRKVCYP